MSSTITILDQTKNKGTNEYIVTEEAKELLRQDLWAEYEIYQYARQRLEKQYEQINQSKG